MKISSKGLGMIKVFEGLRLKAYKCTAGKWTIGYGHTAGVKEGDVIDNQTADRFLSEDLEWAENCVNSSVKVKITQSMYDSLVSIVFNIGAAAFKKSTMLKKLNKSNYIGASEEFGRWIHSGGRIINGLIERRTKEKMHFCSEGFPNSEKQNENLKIPDLTGYTGISITEGLQSKGYQSSFAYRKSIAMEIGISNYTGTAAQNLRMIQMLGGSTSANKKVSLKGYKGFSIVDALKSYGYPYDMNYRISLAAEHGIKNYKGTAAQNTKLLTILKSQ